MQVCREMCNEFYSLVNCRVKQTASLRCPLAHTDTLNCFHAPTPLQDVAKVLTEGDSCTLLHIVRAVNANITARNTSAALNINNTGLVLKHKTGLAMDFPTVRSALLILHQHNCLVIDKPKSSEFDPVAPVKDMKTGFVYSLNVTNILHRMHFARLLSIVKAKYGELAVQIVECVMMYGEVRLDQIAEQVRVFVVYFATYIILRE